MDTPANQIPQFGFDPGRIPDIGSGYAAGIREAGQGITAGVTSALNTLNQNRNVDDTLAAMKQSGMLSNEAYQAVAGKSLGAKQALLGMHAGEWINQQAQARELQKTGYAGAVDVARQTAIMQAQFQQALDAIRKGYPGAAGVDPKKILTGGAGGGGGTGGTGAGGTGAAGAGAPLVGPQGPLAPPAGVTPQITQQAGALAGTGGAPSPLGSGNIYSPAPKLGAPITNPKEPIPPGSTLVTGKGPKGETKLFVKYPDGTHREMPPQ